MLAYFQMTVKGWVILFLIKANLFVALSFINDWERPKWVIWSVCKVPPNHVQLSVQSKPLHALHARPHQSTLRTGGLHVRLVPAGAVSMGCAALHPLRAAPPRRWAQPGFTRTATSACAPAPKSHCCNTCSIGWHKRRVFISVSASLRVILYLLFS